MCVLLIVSLPPLGVFGWCNPITSAGALFPGMGWMGLALTISILYMLAQHKRPLFASLPFAVLALAVNLLYHAPSPVQWVGVDTHIGSARDAFGEFDRLAGAQGGACKFACPAPQRGGVRVAGTCRRRLVDEPDLVE